MEKQSCNRDTLLEVAYARAEALQKSMHGTRKRTKVARRSSDSNGPVRPYHNEVLTIIKLLEHPNMCGSCVYGKYAYEVVPRSVTMRPELQCSAPNPIQIHSEYSDTFSYELRCNSFEPRKKW